MRCSACRVSNGVHPLRVQRAQDQLMHDVALQKLAAMLTIARTAKRISMLRMHKYEKTCINSASLRFVRRNHMDAEGYGAYLDQVEDIR
jgi:hypothetical protein